MKKQFENIYMRRFFYFNVYVIKGKNGDVLIDTGFIGMRRSLKKWLDKFDIKLIILTHAHVDHVWNAKYLKNLYNCKIALSEKDFENLDNSRIKTVPSNKKHKLWTKLMIFGMRMFVADNFEVDIFLKDNQIINEYDLNLKVVSLPGHTDGSIGILYKDYLVAGDSLVNRKKYPEIAYQNQDNKKAILSYKKILKLNPKIVFVGHDKEIIREKFNNNCTKI